MDFEQENSPPSKESGKKIAEKTLTQKIGERNRAIVGAETP